MQAFDRHIQNLSELFGAETTTYIEPLTPNPIHPPERQYRNVPK